MKPNPPDTSRHNLQRGLSGALLARRTPGRSTVLLLLPSGERFGELTIRDSGADLVAGDLSATLEHNARFHYRMFDGAGELLNATPSGRGLERLTLRCGDRVHEVHASPLRNTATARSGEGVETARVSGGLLGLRYRLDFEEGDGLGLLVAVLLLHHLLVLRSRAYRAVPAHRSGL